MGIKNYSVHSHLLFSGINHSERALIEKVVFLMRAEEELSIIRKEQANYLRFYRNKAETLANEVNSESSMYKFEKRSLADFIFYSPEAAYLLDIN